MGPINAQFSLLNSLLCKPWPCPGLFLHAFSFFEILFSISIFKRRRRRRRRCCCCGRRNKRRYTLRVQNKTYDQQTGSDYQWKTFDLSNPNESFTLTVGWNLYANTIEMKVSNETSKQKNKYVANYDSVHFLHRKEIWIQTFAFR